MNPLSEAVEKSMLRDDTLFYWDLVHALIGSKSSGILVLGLQPYISQCVVETHNYLSQKEPEAARVLILEHAEIIQGSRHSSKLLLDTKLGLEGISEFHNKLTSKHYEGFIGRHKGPLARLMILLQGDLGLFTYDDQIICTTHTAQINLGYGEVQWWNRGNEINKLSKEIGIQIGYYVATMAKLIWGAGPPEHDIQAEYNIDDRLISRKDVKASQFYSSKFGGQIGREWGATLVYLFTAIIFVEQVLSNLANQRSNTYFKIQFLTVYHFFNSIRGTQEVIRSNELKSDVLNPMIDEILSDDELQHLANQRGLRNILMHYGLRAFPESSLDLNLAMYGLVEHYFDGTSFSNINLMLKRKIRKLSRLASESLN